MESYKDYLAHHGIKNQKWGKKNGPPYPLTDSQRSAAENRSNPTSTSARILAKAGQNNRFAKSDLKRYQHARNENVKSAKEGTGGGGGSSSGKKAPVTHRGSTQKESPFGKDYDGTTYEEITEDRVSRFGSKYGYDPDARVKITQASEDEKKSKSSKSSSKKTAEQKAAEKAAKEAEKAAEKERKRIEKAEERAMKVIDRLFNGSTSDRDMDALLSELNDGWLNGKNFDAEDFKELAKDPKYKKMMDKIGRESKGSDFYAKVLAQLGDSDDPKIKALRKKYEKIIKEQVEEDAEQGYEELETLKKRMGADYKDKSLDRFSRTISAMTDYVDMMRDANPTDMNRARSRVLSYLEDKLSWFSENGSNSSERTPTLKEKRNMQKVTAWLRRHGF